MIHRTSWFVILGALAQAGLIYRTLWLLQVPSALPPGEVDRGRVSIWVYWAALVVVGAALTIYQTRVRRLALRAALRTVGYWWLLWQGYTAGITLAGALLGVGLFAIFGPLVTESYTLPHLMREGARAVGFIAFVWAPGLSIVLCAITAHRRQQARD